MRTTPTITSSAVSTFKFQQGVTTSNGGTSLLLKLCKTTALTIMRGMAQVGFVHIDAVVSPGLAQDGRFCRGVANGDAFVAVDAEL